MAVAKTSISVTERLNLYLVDAKHKSYFVAAMTVIFVVVIIMLGIRPALTSVFNQNTDNKKRDEAVSSLETKLNALRTMTNESRVKENLVEYFDKKVFPNSSNQEYIISLLNKKATSNNVFLSSIGFAEAPRDANLTQRFLVTKQVVSENTNLVVEGSESNLINFIEDIEQSTKLFNVKSLSMTRKVGEELLQAENGRDFRLSLVIETFYFEQIPNTD